MYKKQLTDLTLVGLKHFFNLEPYIVTQFFILILLMFVVFREQIGNTMKFIWKSWQKMREDVKNDLNASAHLKLSFLRK